MENTQCELQISLKQVFLKAGFIYICLIFKWGGQSVARPHAFD